MADQPYKVELMRGTRRTRGRAISFYRQGDFTDLCAGPHLMSTAPRQGCQADRLHRRLLAGQRKKQDALPYLRHRLPQSKRSWTPIWPRLEEAKKRDHRRLGKELGLFTIMDEGPGFPFFLPKGMLLKNLLIDYWREMHTRAGYQEISTPIILNRTPVGAVGALGPL